MNDLIVTLHDQLPQEPSLIVRASAWGKLFDCAYKFEGENILGMRRPSGMKALLGTGLHASTGVFDQGKIDHAGVSIDDAAGVLVSKLRNPGADVDLSADDMSASDAEKIGLTLHTKYCAEISPRYEFRAVEMATKPLDIDCGHGVIVRLTGTMDRSRIVAGPQGGLGIADLKSGARATEKGMAKTKGHAPQVGTYELLTEHTTGETITAPAEIIGLKTAGTLEVRTGQISGAKQLMVGTSEHRGLIEFAAEMFRTGLFPPNPQSFLCAEKYCARWNSCPYHER